MQEIVVVDDTPRRRDKWVAAVENAGATAQGFSDLPENADTLGNSRKDRITAILAHAGNLPMDPMPALGEYLSAAAEQGVPVFIFSGAGLTPATTDDQEGFKYENKFWPLADNVFSVHRPLGEKDASRVAKAIAGQSQSFDPEDFLAELEGKKWPESLVALYIVALAIDQNKDREEVQKRILQTDWGELITAAKAEAERRNLGEVSLDKLSAENAATAVREMRKCLDNAAPRERGSLESG